MKDEHIFILNDVPYQQYFVQAVPYDLESYRKNEGNNVERRKAMKQNRNEKICIMGGGPAGLAAGMYLEREGYHNYTILEKTDHVGGKCNSPTYRGKRYEMGAIMGVPGYHTIGEIMKYCGTKADGPRLDREFRRTNGRIYNPFGGTRLYHGIKTRSRQKAGKSAGNQVQGI